MSSALCRRLGTSAVRATLRSPRLASASISTSISTRGIRTGSLFTSTPSVRPRLPASHAVFRTSQVRYMADKVVKFPPMAESIQEGTLTQWHKKVGEFIARDEVLATIETDKVDVTVNSPESGTILELYANEGDTVAVGANMVKIELGDAPKEGAAPSQPAPEAKKEAPKKEEAKPAPEPPKPKAEAPKPQAPTPAPQKQAPAPSRTPSKAAPSPVTFDAEDFPGYMPGSRTERRIPMSRMRLKIAKHLKESQENAASLTTFNEIDMSNLMEMRAKYKELVAEKHGVKLGFMGAFIKATSLALHEVPGVNAAIEGNEIVYHDFVDISVAVATPKGLVTPVLRNCESLSIVQVEKAMAALGKKARDNQITIEDLAGGTFTVSNGGVFGSLFGTPIINQPQSAILGMHATKERPVVVNGKVEIRPMMYVALTYDHRVIDGREAVTFLVKLKELIEDPRRILLDL
ncbi:dihydrolipoyllysine-residue succinyltransferase [Spizellomyces sp. 'palustris']|nr:dihydrolipoyllysine-residue succinyltransferase [Spizellomyces sp. 'palustris']